MKGKTNAGLIIIAVFFLAIMAGVAPVASAEWSNVKNIVAEPWLKVSDDPHVALEGLAFDREGNLFVSSIWTGEIWKISPDKKMTSIFKDPRVPQCSSIVVHKDGRLFLCTLLDGKIVSIKPDGSDYKEILTKLPLLEAFVPDDGVFDSEGNYYFTNIVGSPAKPVGGIYRISADLKKVDLVQGDLAAPNGIDIATGTYGKETRLLVTEHAANRLMRIDLLPDKVTPMMHVLGLGVAAYFHGYGPDSARIDEAGNLYICSYKGGRIFVMATADSYFEPVAQILTPGRDKGVQREVPSVVIKPGTDEGYMTVASHGKEGEGAWIMKFKALGNARTPYSHQ